MSIESTLRFYVVDLSAMLYLGRLIGPYTRLVLERTQGPYCTVLHVLRT